MKYYFTLVFFALCSMAIGQKQGNIWYFGEHLGLDFSSGTPVAITGGQTGTIGGLIAAGTTAMSDSAGHLLFYASGEKVWNRNHQVMPNGDNLAGCISSTQGAQAVPLPGSRTVFYLFTTDGMICRGISANKGFCYSVIDMCRDSGRGDIIPGRKNIMLFDTTTEKIAAAEDAAGTGYWVLGRKLGTDAVYAYHLTAAGLNTTPVISHIDTINGNELSGPYGQGQMKLSPNGHKLAIVKGYFNGAAMGLFDFNNTTGVVTNQRRLVIEDPALMKPTIGLEFSPDSRFLYTTTSGGSGPDRVFQYNTTAGGGSAAAINASKYIVYSPYILGYLGGGMQMGPDGRLYIVHGTYGLAAIHNPNQSGAACNFDSVFVPLSSPNHHTLPGFVAGFKYHTGLSFCMQAGAVRPGCIDSCSATAIAGVFSGQPPFTYHWTPGNYTTDTVTNLCPGTYVAQVLDAAGNFGFDTVIVTPLPMPGSVQVTSPPALFCANDSVLICAPPGYTFYEWNDGSTDACIQAHQAGNYYVTVTDLGNCSVQSNSVAVSVYPASAVSVNINGDTLRAFNATNYQWYFNGVAIDSATSSIYVAHQPGNYQVQVTDTNGCRVVSSPIIFSGIDDLAMDGVSIYPNPFNSQVNILVASVLNNTSVCITDVTGKKIFEQLMQQQQLSINTSGLVPGVYFLTLTTATQKVVKVLAKSRF